MKVESLQLKNFFETEEHKYHNKYILFHPFYTEDISKKLETNLFDKCVSWQEAIKKYFSNITIIELYIAFEIYYYGAYYFGGGFGENQEYIEKKILPIVEKIKTIPAILL